MILLVKWTKLALEQHCRVPFYSGAHVRDKMRIYVLDEKDLFCL